MTEQGLGTSAVRVFEGEGEGTGGACSIYEGARSPGPGFANLGKWVMGNGFSAISARWHSSNPSLVSSSAGRDAVEEDFRPSYVWPYLGASIRAQVS